MPRFALLVAFVALALGCASLDGWRLYVSGTEALDAGHTEQAIAELEHARALVPDASEIRNHLGLAYSAAGREGDALHEFQRAVDLDCDNQAAVANLRAAELDRDRSLATSAAPTEEGVVRLP